MSEDLTADRSFKFMYSPSVPAAPPLSGQGFLHDCSPFVTFDSACFPKMHTDQWVNRGEQIHHHRRV